MAWCELLNTAKYELFNMAWNILWFRQTHHDIINDTSARVSLRRTSRSGDAAQRPRSVKATILKMACVVLKLVLKMCVPLFGAQWNDMPDELHRMIIDRALDCNRCGAVLNSVNKGTHRHVTHAMVERRWAELQAIFIAIRRHSSQYKQVSLSSLG